MHFSMLYLGIGMWMVADGVQSPITIPSGFKLVGGILVIVAAVVMG